MGEGLSNISAVLTVFAFSLAPLEMNFKNSRGLCDRHQFKQVKSEG